MLKNNQTQFKETEIGLIPESWEVLKLSDLISVKHGYAFQGESFSETQTDKILLTPGNFSIGGGFNDTKLKYYKGNIPASYLLKEKDLVVTMTDLSKQADTLGYSALVPNNKNILYLHNQRIGLVEGISEKIDKIYLYWLMRSKTYRDWVVGSATGTTVKHTSPSRICAFEFALPPLLEQQKIAEVLGALDDKIELNRKMNKTLGSLGQSIFKHWFIDFAEKDDWKKFTLGSFFPITTGKKDANFSSNDGQYPFFTCSQDNLKADSYSFDCSALLLAGNGEFSIKWYEGKFEAYQRTYVLAPYKKELLGFLYFLVNYSLSDITAGHRGSVIKFLTKGMIEDFEIDLPPEDSLVDKAEIFSNIIKQIDFNKRQIESLSQIRNSLLPRLMSGKLRVK